MPTARMISVAGAPFSRFVMHYSKGIHGRANSHFHKFSTTNSEMASRRLSQVVKDDNKGGAAKRKVNAEARSN